MTESRERTLVGVIEANALDDLTDNIVVVGLGGGGDLTEDHDHTSGDGSLCEHIAKQRVSTGGKRGQVERAKKGEKDAPQATLA